MSGLALLLALLGCQEPFGSDRHTLEGSRIAAVHVHADSAITLYAEALLVVDGQLWSDAPVALVWAWLLDGEDPATWTGFGDALGPYVELRVPEGGARLLLVAVMPDGQERRAVAQIDAPLTTGSSLRPLEFERLPWRLGDLADEDLAADARESESGTPGRVVPIDGFLRVAETLTQGNSDYPLRWMGTAGSWLELDSVRADWTPGDLRLDDGKIEVAEPGEAGVVSLVAIRPAEGQAGGWQVADVFVSQPGEGALVDERWLPGAIPGWQRATLVADDSSPVGLRAVDPEPLAAPTDDTWRPRDDCANPPHFDPSWLATTRCLRAHFDGVLVEFEGVALP